MFWNYTLELRYLAHDCGYQAMNEKCNRVALYDRTVGLYGRAPKERVQALGRF